MHFHDGSDRLQHAGFSYFDPEEKKKCFPSAIPQKNVSWPSTRCQGESNRLKWMVLLGVRPPSIVTIRSMEGDLEVTEVSSWNRNELVTVLTVIMRLWEMCDKCWPPADDVASERSTGCRDLRVFTSCGSQQTNATFAPRLTSTGLMHSSITLCLYQGSADYRWQYSVYCIVFVSFSY